MKRKIVAALVAVCAVAGVFSLSGCKSWKHDFDTTMPDLTGAGVGVANAAENGWYAVLLDEFDADALNSNLVLGQNVAAELGTTEIWTTSPHMCRWDNEGGRKVEDESKWNWWCPDMLSVSGGSVRIRSEQLDNHICSEGICPASGRFTTGIETRRVVGNDSKGTTDKLLFSQAFGYFETRVKVPDCDGLWSAFWLQSSNQRKIGNEGEDGTEIDVYESAFRTSDKKGDSKMGHALIWDGYGKDSDSDTKINKLEQSLYDGAFHTFGLLWTPEYYVFYIDGEPTWTSNGGGVAKVAEFLRLTVEIDIGDGWGPHGQQIGQFSYTDVPVFEIDYVKVYQNKNYKQFEKSDSEYQGKHDSAN